MNALKYPNIEAERVRAGMSQDELIQALGYKERKSYYNWLANGNIPISALIRMSEIFACSVDYLLDLKNESEVRKMKSLREHRLKANLTQAQVAEQLGVQPSTVTMWETGKREPNINTLRRLSELFGCSVDGLLGGTQDPEEKQEPDERRCIMLDLKQRRLELGLTMLEVAKIVGVSEATISRYESGNIKNMRRDRINKYAKALNIDASLLIDEVEWDKEARESRIRIIIDATPEEIAELFSRLKGSEVTSENSEDETSEDESSAGPSDVIAIRKNRQKFGLTQEGLAKILEVTKQAVSQWETGERKPDIVTLKHLAYIFGCTTDELLKDVDFRKGGTP